MDKGTGWQGLGEEVWPLDKYTSAGGKERALSNKEKAGSRGNG
ncbi:hypothetical protein [Lacrimispora sphenoides]|nr:hypothetical protein [Lacrimispora sphenoides]